MSWRLGLKLPHLPSPHHCIPFRASSGCKTLFLPIQWEGVNICSWSLSSTLDPLPPLDDHLAWPKKLQVVIQRGHATCNHETWHWHPLPQKGEPPALHCFSPATAAPGSHPHLHSPRETLGYKHVPQRLALQVRRRFSCISKRRFMRTANNMISMTQPSFAREWKPDAPRTSNIKAWLFFTQPRTRPLALAFAGLVKSFSSCNIPMHFFQQSSNHSSVDMYIWV